MLTLLKKFIPSIKKRNNGSTQVDFDLNINNYTVKLFCAKVLRFLDLEVDHIHYENFPDGTLQITHRNLLNKDFFLFFEYRGSPKTIAIGLEKINESFAFDDLYKKPPYDSRYGENRLTGLFSYIDMRRGSAAISKIYCYKEKIIEYPNCDKSTVNELIWESGDLKIEKRNKLVVQFGNTRGSNTKTVFFILISREKLFRSKKNLKEYMQSYYTGIYNNNVWNSFFMTPAGTLTKLPYSIEPFTKEGYGYSLHHSSRKDMIAFYERTKERFFEDFIMNAIIQAYLYQSHSNGMFHTAYTSTWLKKDTGITAPYIDTRLNETFILMLRDFQKLAPYPIDLDPLRGYADFLYEKYEKGVQVYKADGIDAVFFPDYFKEGVTTLTHTSLNHQLGIAQLVLKANEKYKDQRYLKLFEAMLKFVEITGMSWRKGNGDLFYCVRQKADGELEFYDNDYVYVTLIDLLLIQNACINMNYEPNSILGELIESKIAYLKTTEYDIFLDNPKAASGERADSAKYALNLYKKLNPMLFKGVIQRIEIGEIEVTSHCNLKCIYCNTPTTKYPKGNISEETFAAALKHIVPGQWIGFNGLGEPLLNKNLVRYVSQVVDIGAIPFLNTNGVLLDAYKLSELLEAGLRHMTVSAHTKAGIDAFRMSVKMLIKRGYKVAPFTARGTPSDGTFYLLSVIVSSSSSPSLPEQSMVLEEFPNLTAKPNAHNWGKPIGKPLSEEAMLRRMRGCKSVIVPTAIMRWNGEFIICCRDTENTVKLGHIDSYESIVQDLESYKSVCRWCF